MIKSYIEPSNWKKTVALPKPAKRKVGMNIIEDINNWIGVSPVVTAM